MRETIVNVNMNVFYCIRKGMSRSYALSSP